MNYSFKIWRYFCTAIVKTFYGHVEIDGLENLPDTGPVVLCANHTNALADAVVMQVSCPRHVHPLARSGLFEKLWLKPFLNFVEGVPVYRKQDAGSDTAQNEDMFRSCYEKLAENAVLIIFPEGQSHSDPQLRDIKTGAARIAVGNMKENGLAPALIPVGMFFTDKGSFRSDVLVQYGEPVDMQLTTDIDDYESVRELTRRLEAALRGLTLNADTWEEINLSERLTGFFERRRGKNKLPLPKRFRVLKRLLEMQKQLRAQHPNEVKHAANNLKVFERLCERFGIKDYHLTLDHSPLRVAWFILRSVGLMLILIPLGLWGVINSYIPYTLSRTLGEKISHGLDQFDTSKIALGFVFFAIFWGLQTILVAHFFTIKTAIIYAISLPLTAALAIAMHREDRQIMENIRVFFIFLRKRDLKAYLRAKQHKLEVELAKLARIANRQG